jgi:hypothetical protein
VHSFVEVTTMKRLCLLLIVSAFVFGLVEPSKTEGATGPWNTFLGSSGIDEGHAIAVDDSGNVYVVGTSGGNWGSPVNAHSDLNDAFVAKLDGSGNLLWNTFMGSSNQDYGYAVAVDGSSNVYVVGYSSATWDSPENGHAGGSDAFAAKLNSSGTRLWHTFMGCSATDYGYGVAVDEDGNVYATGYSGNNWGTPVNPYEGSYDAFAAKFNGAGTRLWHTFMGAAAYDYGRGIAVDEIGNVYIAGTSARTWGTPVNGHAGGNNPDAFTAKLNSTGVRLWHTFMGSTASDFGYAVALDGSGNIYLAGTSPESWGVPVDIHSGGNDAVVVKLAGSGTRLWHTFMGCSGVDYGYALMVAAGGNVHVAGYSNATWGSPENAHAGASDAFAAMLNSGGARQWNTFLGSSFDDSGNSIAVDGNENVYLAGTSIATWGSPVIGHAGSDDAFAVKLGQPGSPVPAVSQWGMGILLLLLAGSASWMMRRRKIDGQNPNV